MIKRFRHKGLERFYSSGDTRGINAKHAGWLRILLTALDAAGRPGDLSNPGFGLHPLKGDRKGQWAVWVSGNWRLVFAFDGEDVTNLDLVDYH
ncbi:proteic killer suppression protein [Rhizobiales bacterium GAS191]|nr:proteic killer suppression protein [Rhizobiales bacterium GAS191]SEC99385.1 proteic killer suppression protein [Rhizobiales bacterium GAS188]